MKNLKKIICIIAIATTTIFSLGIAPFTYAADVKNVCDSDAPAEVKAANGCPGSGNTADFSTVIVNILNGIIAILGSIAVIFIVVGGINYMTSQGDPSKVQKAKNTIFYAIIGLIICALAFAIVNFVIINVIKSPQS